MQFVSRSQSPARGHALAANEGRCSRLAVSGAAHGIANFLAVVLACAASMAGALIGYTRRAPKVRQHQSNSAA